LGHELGTTLEVKAVKDVTQIPNELKKIISEFHLGEVEITENTEEIVQLRLKEHSSIKDLIKKGIKTTGSFCSFEAGLLSGVVEKLSNLHCFAQELGCSLQTGENFCEFMIVFQKD